jgi:hypothetical protein
MEKTAEAGNRRTQPTWIAAQTAYQVIGDRLVVTIFLTSRLDHGYAQEAV